MSKSPGFPVQGKGNTASTVSSLLDLIARDSRRITVSLGTLKKPGLSFFKPTGQCKQGEAVSSLFGGIYISFAPPRNSRMLLETVGFLIPVRLTVGAHSNIL